MQKTLICIYDGSLSATGTGKFLNDKDAVLQFNDGWNDSDGIKESFTTTLTTLNMGHLGSKANTGCYSFELCGDTVRIVLMFNIFKDKNGTAVTLDQLYNNVGYSSFINYFNSNTLKLDENYNGAYQGTIPGALYYQKLISCGNWFVNSYAIGSVGEDTLDINFQAYNQTIHFEKVVEQA